MQNTPLSHVLSAPDDGSRTEWALAWAAIGVYVFPWDGESKKPHIQGWQEKSQVNPGHVKTFWETARFKEAWVAADLGKSGLLVVDAEHPDKQEDGLGMDGVGNLEKWQQQNQALPETLVQWTKNKGRHYIYRLPAGLKLKNDNNGKWIPGVDIKTTGGIAVLAGSPGYHIHNLAAIADAPQFLIDVILGSQKPRESPRPSTRTDVVAKVAESLYLASTLDSLTTELELSLKGDAWNQPHYDFACRAYELAYLYPGLPFSPEDAEALIDKHWEPDCGWGNWMEPRITSTRDSARTKITDRAASGETMSIPVRPAAKKEKEPEITSRLVYFTDMKVEPFEWYEKPWLPVVGLSGVAGPEDTGKSTLFIHEIAKLTRGEYGRPPIKVIYLAKEDDNGMIKARFELAGVTPNSVATIAIKVPLDENTSYERDINLKNELRTLRHHLHEDPAIKAVYLDPANSFMGVDEERDGYSTIQNALERLSLFARDEKILIRAMKHTKKSNGQSLPMVSMIYGSKAWTEVIRIFPILWPVSEGLREAYGMDSDDPTNLVLLRGKNNYAPKDLPAKGYQIDSRNVMVDGTEHESVTRIRFTRPQIITNEDLEEKLAETKKETKARHGEENETDVWLADFLRSRVRVPRKEVMEAYKAAGIASDRTLKSRATKMGIISEPIPGDTNNSVFWSLPIEF